MPTFRQENKVNYTPSAMFDLVADVERYPDFLPLCESLTVRQHINSGEGIETLVADMSVGYKSIRESFTTRVTLDRPRLRIMVEYVDGPFRFLDSHWIFQSTDDPNICVIDFCISYEFKNRMLGLLMGSMFDKAFKKFIDTFSARAASIYGTAAP